MADDRERLSSEDLSYLRTAGQWGLLRDMAGWKVCLTGRMSMERTQLAALIEAAGGVYTNSMSQSVRLLVVADDADMTTTKLAAARASGTLIFRESDFAAELLPTPQELLTGERLPFGADR